MPRHGTSSRADGVHQTGTRRVVVGEGESGTRDRGDGSAQLQARGAGGGVRGGRHRRSLRRPGLQRARAEDRCRG